MYVMEQEVKKKSKVNKMITTEKNQDSVFGVKNYLTKQQTNNKRIKTHLFDLIIFSYCKNKLNKSVKTIEQGCELIQTNFTDFTKYIKQL